MKLLIIGAKGQLGSESNLPAKRPRFSAMSNDKICKVLGIEIEDWEEEMKEVLRG